MFRPMQEPCTVHQTVYFVDVSVVKPVCRNTCIRIKMKPIAFDHGVNAAGVLMRKLYRNAVSF